MEKRKFDILSCGLMVCDILAFPLDISVFSVDTAYLNRIDYVPGGDALNVALASSKLGVNVGIQGCIGADMPGDYLVKTLSKSGIDTSGLDVREDVGTATSIILRENSGERHFAYYAGANDVFDGSEISDDDLKNASILYIGSSMALKQLDGAPLAKLFKRAKDAGCMTIMDSTSSKDNVWLPKIEEALKYTDVYIPSLEEAIKTFGETEPEQIYQRIKSYGVQIAGVKLGKKGVYVEGNFVPAYDCDEIADTTGAGDCFMAGFCVGLINNQSVLDCTIFGSAVSNFCIRAPGATTGVPGYDDVLNFIKNTKLGN